MEKVTLEDLRDALLYAIAHGWQPARDTEAVPADRPTIPAPEWDEVTGVDCPSPTVWP